MGSRGTDNSMRSDRQRVIERIRTRTGACVGTGIRIDRIYFNTDNYH